MTDGRSAKSIAAEQKKEQAILNIGIRMLPSKHLNIWCECKLLYPDISPAEVWRVLVNDEQFDYSYLDSTFKHRKRP